MNASTSTFYRHALDRPQDEFTGELGGSEPNAPDTWNFSIDVARRWEEAFYSSSTPATRKVALRSSMTVSPDPGGVFFGAVGSWRGWGSAATQGSGEQYVSWIHDRGLLPRDRVPDPTPGDLRGREPHRAESASKPGVSAYSPASVGECPLDFRQQRGGCWRSAPSSCVPRRN